MSDLDVMELLFILAGAAVLCLLLLVAWVLMWTVKLEDE